ncbi:LysR family transcriptional regulator [Falsirhodobacter sp. 20TX0035]|uniref:LysR family transcriptional regulator n=1 Tax=Falsirhodobacter sp. 20TX0035 TaxID=3022019 RepID=UPI00232B7590|nr:LysR family transcriptional regulator [Falsirhodobacter sp. 20TX0035]MDB6454394.1 LysR family transcriptional regulator [Falsirhodobacter sp. 20TX0035]
MKLNSENLNLNLRHLRALHAIAREGTFSAAAASLGVVPSALSELVRQMEEAVGGALFDRAQRPPRMTPLARQFLTETEPHLDGLDLAVTRLRQSAGLEVGSLSIGTSPSAISELLAPLLVTFLAKRPQIRCHLHDDIAERLASMVADGQLDMAVAGSAHPSPDLRQRAILRDPFGLACRIDHPLTEKARVTLADLESLPLIAVAPDTGTHQILARSGLPDATLHPRLTAHSTVAQLCMIRAGMGVALLPQNAVSLFRDPRIAFLRIGDLDLWRTLYLLEPARRPPSPVAAAFLDRLKDQLG